MLYNDLTEKVIGAAIEVHKILGSGFLEYVYQKAFCHELKLRGIAFVEQAPLDIHYKGLIVEKKYNCDVLIEEKLIVELKATSGLTEIDEAQLLNYIKASQLKLGLLFNFGTKSLQIKRRIL